jgi:hypothetical protein
MRIADSAYEKFIETTNHLRGEALSAGTHSEVEAYLEEDGRELLRLLLQEHLASRGSGWVGEAVCGADGVVRPHKRDHLERGYQSVFGRVQVERTGYGQRGVASLFPLDAQLNLPAQSYSHRLQQRVARQAAKESFEEVVKDIEVETGVHLGKRQVEAIVSTAAPDFEAFYAQSLPEDIQRQAQSKPIQVLTFDGKGVVMRPEGWREGTRQKAEGSPPRSPRRFSHQAKANRKRMATVAGIYYLDRQIRCPRTVARQFAPLRLVPHHSTAAPKPVAKRLWTSLEKPMKAVIEAGFEEGVRRDPHYQAEWVAWVDGDTTQIDSIKQAAKKYGATVVIILDIIHLEYLWKAANALFDPEDTHSTPWVADRIEQFLQGQRTSMVRCLRRTATVKGLSPKQREPIEQCITYLTNHAPYLNYPQYLAKGYPIATGVIEGACRYVVKDRLEITGARWGLEGGKAVLKLRALYLNGDFDAYWKFHEQQEYQRHHQAKFSEMPKARPHLQLIPTGKGCWHYLT